MSVPEYDVSRVSTPPMPSVHTPLQAPHPADVPQAGEVRNLLPDAWAPYALAGSVIVTLAGQELLNPAPWDRTRVGAILVNLGGLALAWLTKAPQVKAKH